MLLGEATLELRAQLESEPDKLAAGINFGPRILLSQDGLRASGLLQPGSLVRWSYRLSLPSNASDDAALTRFTEDLQKTLPDSGFETRSRVNAAPQFQRNIERFAQFLTLVGLAALIVGGVGVANAVARLCGPPPRLHGHAEEPWRDRRTRLRHRARRDHG